MLKPGGCVFRFLIRNLVRRRVLEKYFICNYGRRRIEKQGERKGEKGKEKGGEREKLEAVTQTYKRTEIAPAFSYITV